MIVPTFYMERPVMYRERAARMYAVLPWVQVRTSWPLHSLTTADVSTILGEHIVLHYVCGRSAHCLFSLVVRVLVWSFEHVETQAAVLVCKQMQDVFALTRAAVL